MLSEFEKKVLNFASAEGLLHSKGKILLAVSGGADSIALLHSMLALKAEGYLGAELICAHLNHQLRGIESDQDEKFVAEQICNVNLRFVARRLEVRRFARRNKMSIETAARMLRIENLLEIAAENGCRWIATGHQRDDNAETVLQRMLRGTGFRGLGGIWPSRDFGGVSFIRPLLAVTREEVVEYLKRRGLGWREDSTNIEYKYKRNFIRHRVIPMLQEQCTGSLVQELSDLATAARKFYRSIYKTVEKVWLELAKAEPERVEINLPRFLAQTEPVKVELIRQSLSWLGSGERDLTEGHYERILELAKQRVSNKKIDLPGDFLVWREYRRLVFARDKKSCRPDEFIGKSEKIKMPGKTRFGNFLIEANVLKIDTQDFEEFKQEKDNYVEWLDLDKLNLPLDVRFRREGDRFIPLGLKEEKKVGKFLTDVRVPVDVRENILIVSDSEKIIWLWPIRIDEQVKIGEHTRKILQLKITKTKKG